MLSQVRSSLATGSRQAAGRLARSLERWSRESAVVPDAMADAAASVADEVEPGSAGRTTAQLVTTAVSLLLIAGLAGIILVEGFSGDEEAPVELRVEVRVNAAEQRGDHFHIPIVVYNLGSELAEQVLVAIEVSEGERIVAETETVIAVIGEDEEAEAMLVLDRETSGLTIEARIMTFQTSTN
jgi:uncharacterized protein (TIGR02588 family)